MRRIFPTLLVIVALAMLAFACGDTDDDDDDDDNDIDDDDDDDGPPQVDFDGWQIPDPLEGVIYRITDGVWEDLFIPPGFRFDRGGIAGYGDAVYTWQEESDCAVWRLGNGWKEVYRGSGEDAHMPDIAFYAKDTFIGYLYDHYNEPNTDRLVKYDPATDELEWINQDLEPRGVFAGFHGDAYAYDAQTIYRYDGVELTTVATLPTGEIRAVGPLGDGLFVVTQDTTVFWDGAQWSTLLEDAYPRIYTDVEGDMLLANETDDGLYYLRYVGGGAEPLDWFDASGCGASLLPGDAVLFRCRYAPPDLACPEDELVNFHVLVVDGVPYCDADPATGILLIDGASWARVQ
ncbi:MAG TPA: hypothetical protein PKW95_10715 [bacterium]|nr:hypothetical protein [bacterium]